MPTFTRLTSTVQQPSTFYIFSRKTRQPQLTLKNEICVLTLHLAASALDEKGILGIEGKLISGEEKYFAAEFLAAAASGYADSTIQRDQNLQGNYVEKPGTDTYAKKALTSALSKTADRFGEKLKSVPEYAVLEGPFDIQVLITEEPKLNQ